MYLWDLDCYDMVRRCGRALDCGTLRRNYCLKSMNKSQDSLDEAEKKSRRGDQTADQYYHGARACDHGAGNLPCHVVSPNALGH